MVMGGPLKQSFLICPKFEGKVASQSWKHCILYILGHTHNDAQVVPHRKLSSEIPRFCIVCINLKEWVWTGISGLVYSILQYLSG